MKIDKRRKDNMNKLLKLDNIMYKVSDLDKAVKFYMETFGLKRLWKDDKSKMVGLGMSDSNTEIVLQSNPDLPTFDFSYSVENVEDFIAEATKKGFTLTFGPIEVRIGKYAVLEDEDHNKIPIIDLTKYNGVPQYN